uniref:DUF659 domain-containing protein n=1 Tax=Sipha flava TaxID=143950 RepID=A0A2S2PVX4_9HEMI
MPKSRSNIQILIKQWIALYNKTDHTIFTTDGSVVFCQLCDKKIVCTKKFQIQQHVDTALHKSALNRKANDNKQQFFVLDAKPKSGNIFNEDFCSALIVANIPWNKLQIPEFKNFLEKYTGKHIPDESILRKNYLGPCYNNVINAIREIIGNSDIWIAVDETTDTNGRYIANLLVGVLECDTPSQPYLLACKELPKTNHSTVSRFINDSLKILWSAGGNDENLRLFLSDAAPYMVKTGDALKVFYPNIIHVTCVAHMLNRVAEKVRELFPDVNKLINNVKKSFLKSPSRIQLYKEMLPGLPLPPEPVITRWGTWIEAVIFNANNYEDIKSVIEKLDNDSSASVDNCKKMFNLTTVKNDLTFIKINFSGLIRAITNLEDTKLTLLQSLEITKNIISELSNIQGDKGSIIKNKISQLYQKNKGFQVLEQIGLVISGNNEIQIPENFNPCSVANMKYAPLTSVDVERSFSLYKHILSDRRINMTPEHMEEYIIVNSFYKK